MKVLDRPRKVDETCRCLILCIQNHYRLNCYRLSPALHQSYLLLVLGQMRVMRSP